VTRRRKPRAVTRRGQSEFHEDTIKPSIVGRIEEHESAYIEMRRRFRNVGIATNEILQGTSVVVRNRRRRKEFLQSGGWNGKAT